MTDISIFNYLNKKHLIEIISSKRGNKLPPELKNKMDSFTKFMEDVLGQYCNTVKFQIEDKDKKVTWFLYEDLDLNLETVYVSGSNIFNRTFLLDVIKVVSFT